MANRNEHGDTVDWGPAWRRAFRDAVSAQTTPSFIWLGQAALATASSAAAVALSQPTPGVIELVLRAVIGGLVGLCGAFILFLLFYFLRAPYIQRDEARAEARRREDWRIGMKQDIYRVVEANPDLGIVDVARKLDLHVDNTMPRAVIELVRELINDGKLTNTSSGLRVR